MQDFQTKPPQRMDMAEEMEGESVIEEISDELSEKIYTAIVDIIGKEYVVISTADGEERDVVQLEEILPELLYRTIKPTLTSLTEAHKVELETKENAVLEEFRKVVDDFDYEWDGGKTAWNKHKAINIEVK